jgi:general secretion pathway protein C
MRQIAIPEKLYRRLPMLTSILILVMLAAILVTSGNHLRQLLLSDEKPSVAPLAPSNQASSPAKINYASIIARKHLFGTSTPDKTRVVDAPTTKLNLKLRGVYSTGDETGAVIIADGAGKEDVYQVDDKLPGGAKLVSIHPDHVIIERNLQLEKLILPEGPSAFTLSETPEESQDSEMQETGSELSELRQELIKNPTSIGKLVSLSPSMDSGGQLEGYKIYPRGKQPLFDELGFMPGDLVTEINGTPLTDSRQSLAAIQKLMQEKELNITIQRDGEIISIQQSLE